ncbi:MAG TPA: FkbM family methyltransferase [Steroidobacteraceae bacterium]|jgi:FkbM family methyltransferase
MIVNTRRLFVKLLSTLGIGTICDIGSMDAADALLFRDAARESTIYAFEPNPDNFRLMQTNRSIQAENIQVVPMAVTDHDGEADFFIVEADYAKRDAQRGMSSLYRRSDDWSVTAAVVRVMTTRLDTFLADKCASDAHLALWIDTEGKAHEVLEGITGVAERVDLVHVEVETTPCIGSNQKLYPQVKALLGRLGFTELATDQAVSQIQFNALFVRSDLRTPTRLTVRAQLLRSRVRDLIFCVVNRICPTCIRRYKAARSHVAARSGR